MSKTLQKILYTGALVGALGFGGCGISKILVEGIKAPIIRTCASGYSIKITDSKIGRIEFEYDQKDNEEILRLGNYCSPLRIILYDEEADGIVEYISTDLENFALWNVNSQKLEQKQAKANKIFTKYKTQLKDIIQKAEKEWREKYSTDQDPLDYYLK